VVAGRQGPGGVTNVPLVRAAPVVRPMPDLGAARKVPALSFRWIRF
jgi:hypothetical protein